jgi:DnaJ-domain-containing protein 1
MPQDQRAKLEGNAKLLLLWMAASDGKLEESELEFVSAQFPDAAAAISNEEFITVIRKSDVVAIEKAVRAIAAESREIRTGFLDMAIAMCMADKDIAIAENHVLRFYADALHLGVGMLEKRYQALTGVPLPEPGDPGSLSWWDERSASEQQLSQDPEVQAAIGQPPAAGMTIAQAQAVLGVALNATQADIEMAYRKMAAVFEVDRDEAMGEADVSAANSRFRKIQQAYHILRTKS